MTSPEKYTCHHIDPINDIPFHRLAENIKCNDCECIGPNLWLCLQEDCLHIGCAENFNDHSTLHFMKESSHCVHINLSSKRIWCYICEAEVFLNDRNIVYENDVSDNEEEKNDWPRTSLISSTTTNTYISSRTHSMSAGDSDEQNSSDSDEFSELAAVAVGLCSSNENLNTVSNDKPRGLVGLQNIGNTCYMNSALQALSNTPPLTTYFLEYNTAWQNVNDNKKTTLSRTYQKLVKDMWNKKTRGYVVPTGILYGIRNVYSMFRGYQQHDTQEFLRCFMDQLHEELKEPCTNLTPIAEINSKQTNSYQETDVWCDSPSPSQSEGEYETCDSGVSERSSLSDDTERVVTNLSTKSSSFPNTSNKRKLSMESFTNSPTPRCKLTTVQYSHIIDTQPSNNANEGNQAIHQKNPVKYRSVISDLFDGKLLSSVQCLTCNRISTRIETFQDLSLPIPGRDHITMLHQSGTKTMGQQVGKPMGGEVAAGLVTCADTGSRDGWWSLGWLWGWLRSWFYGPAVSLHDCLSAFFSADELKGDNMYSCEKCKKLRNGVKYSKVIELPEVLCIHLKRFRHELMFSSKISNPVSFPMRGLDMRPYLHPDCISEINEYDLTSVICHHGTAGGGHYTCYALNPQRGTWFEFDDQYVTQVSPETVEACEAYVLFYKKSSRSIVPIRQKVWESVELQGVGELRFFISRRWFIKFKTCAEPGPIDNTDFLCGHGAVRPSKIFLADKLSIAVSQPVWEYLQSTFGGGPSCNHLYACPMCERQAESHMRRINYELNKFTQLNKEFQQLSTSSSNSLEKMPSGAIYAIRMKWLRSWQAFVQQQTDEPPGPIDNSAIVLPETTNTIKSDSDYAQISEELWLFLHQIYGGGPAVQLRPGLKEMLTSIYSASSPPSLDSSPKNETISDEMETVSVTTQSIPLSNYTAGSSSEDEANDTQDSGSHSTLSVLTNQHGSGTKREHQVSIFTSPLRTNISVDLPGMKRPPKVYVVNNNWRRRRMLDSSEPVHIHPGRKSKKQSRDRHNKTFPSVNNGVANAASTNDLNNSDLDL